MYALFVLRLSISNKTQRAAKSLRRSVNMILMRYNSALRRPLQVLLAKAHVAGESE